MRVRRTEIFSRPAHNKQMNEVPLYRLKAQFYDSDCHLRKIGEYIAFDGEPNDDMEPANEAATKRVKERRAKLEALPKLQLTLKD